MSFLLLSPCRAEPELRCELRTVAAVMFLITLPVCFVVIYLYTSLYEESVSLQALVATVLAMCTIVGYCAVYTCIVSTHRADAAWQEAQVAAAAAATTSPTAPDGDKPAHVTVDVDM